MDGYQDEVDSLRGSGGRMILKMGFRTLTSPKRSADRDKNEPSRFLGDGVSFRAKLIGILEVGEARGERMCQEALADLKMAVRAAGEHKQRIVVCVAIDGLRLRDDKTGDCLYHHPVHKISFIAQDMTDSRAFGYIFGSPDTGHRFFGIKTDKAASQVVIAMRDLFQVVFELKKKEIEMAKQHIEQQQLKYSSSGASKLVDSSSKESGDQGKMRPIAEDQPENGGGGGRGSGGHRRHAASSAAVVAISPPPRHPNALHHQQQQQTSEVIADLLDLEIELSSIQAGIHQMEKMTPSDPFGPGATTPSAISSLHPPSLPSVPDTTLSPTVSVEDPFGDSFVGPPNIPTALPPPPSTAATPPIPVTSSSLSIQGCKVQRQGLNASVPSKGASGGIAESTWFERPLGSEDLFGEALPQGGETEAGREQEKGNLNGIASQTSIGAGDFNSGKGLAGVIGDDVKGVASAGNASQFDVFTELDPLGTGRSRPYVDKKDFFQELKNPPKKVLRDLVGGVDTLVTYTSAAAASAIPSVPAIGAPPAPSAAFCSSSAPLFHAMFDSGDVSQTSSDLFSSSDLFFPPPGVGALSLGTVASAAHKGTSKNIDGVFPACGQSASGDATPSPLVSSLAATDAGADDPFADTDPFADEGSAPVAASLSDLDVAGIFPRIEDDPFDTGFADFTALAGSSRRKRLDHDSCTSATLGRRPRSSKGISHGPLRVSLPPEKGASKVLESPVLLPPPPSDALGLTTGTVPRSRSRSPRIPRQPSAGGSRVPSPKSGVQRHRALGAPVVARTSSEGAYSSSPQSPPEPPPRPPSSGGVKPPPLPPKRVTVGPSAAPLAPLRVPFPDEDDEDDASQYEFIDQYETSRPTVSSPSPIEAKSDARAKRADVGLPPPPRRQHQRASPSGEQSASTEATKQTQRTTAPAARPATSGVRSEHGGATEASAPTFDLTLAELGRMSIADLASALRIPPERVSTMTLQELAEMLSASRAKTSKSPDKIRETCKDEEHIKRDRYAALRESLDDESVANSTNFNADFDAKFDNDFAKEEGPKILDDVFREAPFDKYAVFRELIESEADVNEKTEEINDQTVPTEEETGSAEAADEGRGASPTMDASASDASKEGDACSRGFESQPGEQTDEKESASVAGKEEEEEESSREETEDKYAALREICLMGDKEGETAGAANSSEEKKALPVTEPESAAEREAVDLLVLSRRASEAPEEEGKRQEDTRAVEARGSERENAGWANFEAEATEKATDGGDSEEAVSPWSSEGREAVGWGGGDGAWANEARIESSTRTQSKMADAGYGARGEGKRAVGTHRACRWKERRACTAEEEDEEDEEAEEERRGRRGRSRRSRRAVSPWGREEEEPPRRRCWEEPSEEAWAKRAAGRGSCWDGPPPPRRARPPPSRARKPSTWGDEEDEGEEDGEWVQQQRREGEEGGERWRARKRRGRRRTGSVEWDAEGEDEGEEEEEGEEERGRWRGLRRQGGSSWGEEEEGGWGGAWGAARQRGPTRSRSYRSWDEEDEAEEDYREGEGRWAGAEEEEEGGERRRRRARTASGESSASIRTATLYPRHSRYEQDEAPPIAGRGRGREGGVAPRRRTATPSGSSGQRKSAARWQQQQWREEEGGEGGRWSRRATTGSTIQSSRGGGSRRGRQRGKEAASGGKAIRAPSRGSSGGRLQSPFEDDFVRAAGGGGSSVSSDVSESRRSPVAPPAHNGRCSDDVFLPCESEIGDGTAFPFPAKSGRAADASSSAQRPFSAPVDGTRHQADRFHGPRERGSGTVPSSRSAQRTQRQSNAELGNGSIRKSESVNIFARDSDPFDDDFFSSGSTCAEKGKTGCGSRQVSSAVSDPFKWTEPFDQYEFREEEEDDEEEDEEEEEEEEEDTIGGRERCRERKGATAVEGAN